MRASNANVAKIKQTVSRHRSARIVSIALVQVLVMVAVLIAALYHINWVLECRSCGVFEHGVQSMPQPPKLIESVKNRQTCLSKT
jgi:hypothetical protein